MTINWFRPSLGLIQNIYKILAKKCVAMVNRTWKKQTTFINAVTNKVSLHFAKAIDI
jgi:hypothetical protein